MIERKPSKIVFNVYFGKLQSDYWRPGKKIQGLTEKDIDYCLFMRYMIFALRNGNTLLALAQPNGNQDTYVLDTNRRLITHAEEINAPNNKSFYSLTELFEYDEVGRLTLYFKSEDNSNSSTTIFKYPNDKPDDQYLKTTIINFAPHTISV